MSSHDPENNHVEAITWDRARDCLQKVNPQLASAIDCLFAETRPRRLMTSATENRTTAGERSPVATAPLFLARYSYGQHLVGPARDSGRSIVLPPCQAACVSPTPKRPIRICRPCQDLATACGRELPVGIILSNSVEVYVNQEARTTNAGTRPVGLRLIGEGEAFGVFETLDWLDEPKGSQEDVRWLVSAGARSTFFSLSFGNTQQARILADAVGLATACEAIGEATTSYNSLKKHFEEDHWKIMRLLAKLAGSKWMVEVLILPRQWIEANILSAAGHASRSEAKDFLLALHGIGWHQSKNLRKQSMQAGHITTCLRDKPGVQYYERTARHILSLASGDVPCLIPFSGSEKAGPFSEILHSLVAFRSAPGIRDRFPAILHSSHLTSGNNSYGYYSLRVPTLLGPLKVQRSVGQFAGEVYERLNHLISVADLDHALDWPATRFVSANDPAHQLRQVPEQMRDRLSNLGNDFRFQLDRANKEWKIERVAFFNVHDEGFLGNFLRIVRRD
jgi:hypothetical protein